MTAEYAEDYFAKGVLDFAFYALSSEQIRNVERNTRGTIPKPSAGSARQDPGAEREEARSPGQQEHRRTG